MSEAGFADVPGIFKLIKLTDGNLNLKKLSAMRVPTFSEIDILKIPNYKLLLSNEYADLSFFFWRSVH